MQLATKYNIIFFSWPVAAAFILLFTVISGPGSKIWLVVVETKAYTIKIGALGICAGETCLSSGLGYDPGDQLGKIIPQFPAAAICHLITFILIIIGTCSHAYFLPRIHLIHDTRLSWIMWIVPGYCSLFLGICIIIDVALLVQLKNDKALEGPSVGSGNGVAASTPPGSTVNATNVASGPTNATNPVSVSPSYPATGSVPVGILPNNNPSGPPLGVPQKLSLRALSNSTNASIPSTSTVVAGNEAIPSKPVVTASGAFYLPIICLTFCLIWLYLGFHFLKKSKTSEETREEIEEDGYREKILQRKQVREENPVEGAYGWYNFGKPAAGRDDGEQGQGQGGAGYGLGKFAPAWMMGGGDKDGAPAGFV